MLIVAYAAFLIGVKLAGGGYRVEADWLWLFGGLLLAFRRRTAVTLALVVLFGFGLGLWRGGLFADKLAAYESLYDQKIVITAVAAQDGIYGKGGQIAVDAASIRLSDGTQLTGKIQLSGFGVNSIYQGDELQVSGKLRSGFGAYQGRMSFAQLQLIDHHPSLIAEIRRRFAAGMTTALPEPAGSFSMGLLIGQRATLPDEVKTDLTRVGLTHIIAVSGYNLTIILRASKGLLGKSSKRMSTGLTLGLIGTFLLLTGSSASIVRASIVSVLSIMAGYYGRDFRPLGLILLAAAMTAWANPVYVWSDVSWYLSFLAFYGVMALAPAFNDRLRPGGELPTVIMVGLESISAEMMTLPYVLYTFGQMSFIGLPANVLVTTLVPLAMLLGTVAGLAGMLIGPLAGWLAWPARIVLTYMLDVAHVLSHVPHIFVENIGFSWPQMLLTYCLVIAFGLSLQFKIKSKNDTITDKKTSNLTGAEV